ncbi:MULTISPECIES: glycosyltransferase family 4 protein [unclassified Pseudoalteromonas]|uniref:glycosyltransferase family 4 protein n=1 Tax=unclassified Pseudoalteromonas TaxID=194690 RepID=UPI00390C88E8|nr:glycosyltransferase [Ningiella sp. W23]
MKVLVLSNMSFKQSAPMQGVFVDNQVDRLNKKDLDLDYCKMKWNTDSFLCRALKYPVFLMQFIFQCVFRFKCYDVIHVHYYFPTIILAAVYKFLRNRDVKIIVTCHGSDIYLYDPPRYLYRTLSNVVNHWIFTSEQLHEKFYRPVSSYSILCAGYNDNIFYNKNKQLTKKYDFLQVCSLDKNKGIDRFLSLVAMMPEQQFALVGEGPMKQEVLAAQAQFSNLNYFGKQKPEKLVDIIHQTKFILSLSRNESFGLTLSEAQACGVPAVATSTDGSKAQIDDASRCIEQKNISEEQLLANLKDSMTFNLGLSPKQYDYLSITVSKTAESFSLTRVIEQIVTTYNAVFKGNL